ncbi:protein of unknown function DUF106 transmembrane [Methanococcus vannielii SB]|jgi:uncharacterized membrane protein (DUF106 family)|uniref:DUF106 domain-containing protein n=1 Tax=Methanococcus vannielii (strain ATCC 35089 / DSM 1224 / JCM 13029 / OCM 148 / SB) TaxID=406327 RepID=A6UP40_METVS|nr:EMC3/TMCO1 family protein [Methanococcus vannielii]ABR54262.1 protein of unknown function DUF106 transmembrane [Methanococcus vannielii SB]
MFESIYSAFYSSMDAIFLPMVQTMEPAIFIFLTALLVSFIINLATKLLVNQGRMAELKKELQEFQVKARKASKDPELMAGLQKEQQRMMEMQMEMMKMSFKPMIYTWVPIIIIFAYLRHVYDFGGIYHTMTPAWNGVIVELPIIISKVLFVGIWHWIGGIFYHGGFGVVSDQALGWLGWYIMCSMGTSMVLRKLMGIK